MGSRLYNPQTGSFTSADQVAGGNATPYVYPEDPVNDSDISGNYGYKYYYPIYWAPWVSPKKLFSAVAADIGWVFTFPNNCHPLRRGKTCKLFDGIGTAPVKISWVSDHSFTFLSEQGHPEGPGKHIRFSIFRKWGEVTLRVHAWGPDNTWCNKHVACDFGNKVAAYAMWLAFAAKIAYFESASLF